jgi:hypothetical protein
MDWLIIFLRQLLGMWTPQDDASRPGWARRYAPAYADKRRRTVAPPGIEWFPPATTARRSARFAPKGPPDG